METGKLNWAGKIFMFFLKELKSEWRSKVSINSIILFSVVTLILISYSIGPYKIEGNSKGDILSALLMLSLFFSSSIGLSRAFVKEEEQKTALTTKMALDPLTVFLGKLLFNLILILSISAIITPLFCIFMEFYIKNLCYFIIVMLLSMLGLSIVSTFISAIVSKASMKGALFPILTFPILMPLILEGTKGLSLASSGQSLFFTQSAIVLVSYSGISFFGSILLFERVWKE
ncbi:MAG: heme exporter protein CcmB [Thermoanaerobaculia bacterium]